MKYRHLEHALAHCENELVNSRAQLNILSGMLRQTAQNLAGGSDPFFMHSTLPQAANRMVARALVAENQITAIRADTYKEIAHMIGNVGNWLEATAHLPQVPKDIPDGLRMLAAEIETRTHQRVPTDKDPK